MSRLKAAAFVIALALPASSASAQVPPIVQKFVAAVSKAQTLSIEMTQATRFLPLRKAPAVTRAEFSLEKPNKFAVTWTEGKETILAAASDGVTLSEWDTRSSEQQPAPKNLEAMLTPLRSGLLLRRPGAAAAEMAFVLFTHPDALAAVPNLQDSGAEQVDGVQTRKVTALTPEGSADFWFDADTGLPVQIVVSDGSSIYTIRFLSYRINTPIPDTVFAAPPGPLTRMLTGHTALHFLEPGSLAPDFSLKTPEGRTQTLSALRGQAVLIVFCPLWSLPERALALVQRARSARPAKDLTVLWVAETDKPESVAAFAQAHPNLTALVDPPPWPETVEQKLYRVQATPMFYAVDRTGRIVTGLLGVLGVGESRQQIISADTRAAAVSVLLNGWVTPNALSEYNHVEDTADDASLEAALDAAERTTSDKKT